MCFRFKQFTIRQDQCAMKVGTDGVLLGAWASPPKHAGNILDIGTGTGLIALMLAQRFAHSHVTAIEADAQAATQAKSNFAESTFANQLQLYHVALQVFVNQANNQFDAIVCNPPFYTENVKSKSQQRDMARQNQSLPFDCLLASASQLLNPNGVFATIVPFAAEDMVLDLAKQNGLFLSRRCRVRGNNHSKVKRSLLEFGFHDTTTAQTCLVIEKERHLYTDAYIDLTKDFYLKM